MDEKQDKPPAIIDDEEFRLPRLIDDELAAALTRRGKRERQAMNFRTAGYLILGGIIGFLSTLTKIDIIPLIGVFIFACVIIGKLLTDPIQKAMIARRHDVVAKQLPRAIYWTSQLSPFSFYYFMRALQLQVNLILMEGRYPELEIVSRFGKGYSERTDNPHGVPKNWAVANNLALAHMQQGRFAEAAELFTQALLKAKHKRHRLLLLSNMSFCQMRQNLITEATENNQKALLLSGRESKTSLDIQILIIESILLSKQGKIDEAEVALENLRKQLKPKQLTPDMVTNFDLCLADYRWKQKRYDEAKLYFHNALDVLRSADNPNYYIVAREEHEYAKCLLESGDEAGANKALARAREYFNFYLQREIDTIDLIKTRLASGKPIRQGAELLDLAHRSHYVPSIELQRDLDSGIEPKLIEPTSQG